MIGQIERILIDMPREGRVGKVMSNFFLKKGYDVVERTLSIGDIVVELKTGEKLFIERKEIGDWYNSYVKKNGKSRLRNQAVKLSKKQYKCVVVYGIPEKVRRKNPTAKYFNMPAFKKMKANIMLFYAVPVFYVDGDEMAFLNELDIIIKTFQKHVVEDIKITDNNIKIKTEDDSVNILASYGGIGEKKAKLLLNKFNTIKGIFNASDSDILDIKGVGKKLLTDIRALQRVIEK